MNILDMSVEETKGGLFRGFAGVWTPVVSARGLGSRPRASALAGERLVLFRGEGGAVGALLDRCPHRGVELSRGRVREGCLECPFHGWRFGVAGDVRHVPWNPDARLERLGATALPARELAGAIWVYTGAEPGGEPAPPPDLAGMHLAGDEIEVATHWTRAMENAIDAAHLPFVHRGTIGRGLRSQVERARMDTEWTPTEYGARTRWIIDGESEGAWIDFYRPNIMALRVPAKRTILGGYVAVVPLDDARARFVSIDGRNILKSRVFDPIFRAVNRRILAEDRAVIATSDPPEVPPPGVEQSVRTDRVTLQFRRYYDQHLRHSVMPAPRRLAVIAEP